VTDAVVPPLDTLSVPLVLEVLADLNRAAVDDGA